MEQGKKERSMDLKNELPESLLHLQFRRPGLDPKSPVLIQQALAAGSGGAPDVAAAPPRLQYHKPSSAAAD